MGRPASCSAASDQLQTVAERTAAAARIRGSFNPETAVLLDAAVIRQEPERASAGRPDIIQGAASGIMSRNDL